MQRQAGSFCAWLQLQGSMVASAPGTIIFLSLLLCLSATFHSFLLEEVTAFEKQISSEDF